jgi:tyrosinase
VWLPWKHAVGVEWSFSREATNLLRFWDWQLDWQNLTNAPIWDDEHGFGTSGVAEKSKSAILNGHCVVNGPFKDFVIPYLDTQETPHCLSRGFAQGKELQKQAEMVSPNEIESLLALHSYDAFNLGLEHGPHLAIPRFVRGDFLLLTAPSGQSAPIAKAVYP